MLSFRRLGQRASLATTKKYLDRQEHLQPKGTKSHKARPREGANHHKGDSTLVVVSPHKQARLRCGAGPVLLPRFDNGVPDVSHQQRASRIRDKVT